MIYRNELTVFCSILLAITTMELVSWLFTSIGRGKPSWHLWTSCPYSFAFSAATSIPALLRKCPCKPGTLKVFKWYSSFSLLCTLVYSAISSADETTKLNSGALTSSTDFQTTVTATPIFQTTVTATPIFSADNTTVTATPIFSADNCTAGVLCHPVLGAGAAPAAAHWIIHLLPMICGLLEIVLFSAFVLPYVNDHPLVFREIWTGYPIPTALVFIPACSIKLFIVIVFNIGSLQSKIPVAVLFGCQTKIICYQSDYYHFDFDIRHRNAAAVSCKFGSIQTNVLMLVGSVAATGAVWEAVGDWSLPFICYVTKSVLVLGYIFWTITKRVDLY